MFKNFFRLIQQKGQVLVFFSATVPILFLFTAAAADFGWMYFNQSRLQNASDAAAIAGAKQLVFDEQNLSDYTYTKLVSNTDEDLMRLVNAGTISKRDTSDGDKVVEKWLKINLYNGDPKFKIVDISPPRGSDVENDNVPSAWNTIKFKHMLYGSDEQDYKTLYYVVTISEQLEHLFPAIVDNFSFIPHLKAKVFSVVKISHYKKPNNTDDPLHGPSLYQQMKELREIENYATWDHIKHEYDITPKDQRPVQYKNTSTDNIARARSVQANGNAYVEGNFYRTETLTLHGYSKATNGWGAPNNSVAEMNQLLLDNLFVDFKIDIKGKKFSKDEDLGGDTKLSGVSNTEYNLKPYSDSNSDRADQNTNSDSLNYRIHDLINIGRWYKTGVNPDNTEKGYYNYEYKVRNETFLKQQGYKEEDAKKKAKEPPDPLYVYIENENIYSHEHQGDGNTSFNTVRQIIININATNKNENTDRPMFFFYDGPEKIDSENKKKTWHETWRESWKYTDRYQNNARNSLPVIVNFYADFRGVFFFPNSPIVINGNGKNFEGFVVAQEYLRLKTAEDFPIVATVGSKATERGSAVYKDGNGNVLYHEKAKGGTRYIQIVEGKEKNVIYVKDDKDSGGNCIFPETTLNPESVTEADHIYKTPEGKYVKIDDTSKIIYTYTLITEEKSNLISTYTGTDAREKEYVTVDPMYIDLKGNVQYMTLNEGATYTERPTPLDSSWHAGDAQEIIFKPSTFHLNKVRFSSYNKVLLVDYTQLNDSNRNINDVFYTTVRSDWID